MCMFGLYPWVILPFLKGNAEVSGGGDGHGEEEWGKTAVGM